MIKRPKPSDDEDDLLRMQEDFLREKSKDPNFQPAALVTNLRRTELTKRGSPAETGTRKLSKYAQSKGLNKNAEKRPRTEENSTNLVGDILEKNMCVDDDAATENKEPEVENDKVYFPKVIPTLLGNIVEKNLDQFFGFDTPMPSQGFPVATKRDLSLRPGKKSIYTQEVERKAQNSSLMEIDKPSCSKTDTKIQNKPTNLPEKSYILSSNDSNDIHKENVKILTQMSENDILEEQQKLLSSLDPKLVAFMKAKRTQHTVNHPTKDKIPEKYNEDKMDTSEELAPVQNDTLWENDVLSHPNTNQWLHFDSLEKDKLEWIKGIEESKKIKTDEPYEARFNFKGYLLPYSIEYTEETKSLFHHGEDPHRPGYSIAELFELSRSTITQQRVMALNTLAGVLEYYMAGIYKDVIELPISKIFFIIRIAMDENKAIILEPALKAMRNLLYNRIDEASLDALVGFEEGIQQPCLENDKSEIEELDSKESELKDFHLAEIDLIAALLRTDILQRLYYILENVRPSFNCIQYAFQILTRLVRDTNETALKIAEMDHLMMTVINNFVPVTSVNFAFDPQIVYNGKPVLAAMKFLRVLSVQSREINEMLVSKYNILRPVAEYVSSGVDGTYGLRIQIDSFCILSNLLHFNVGIDTISSLCPIIATSLYKHVQATDVYVNSSVISATHAAVVLQLVNKLLNSNVSNLETYKHQFYPLIKDGFQKWIAQTSRADSYTCAHLRLVCASLDCCKTMFQAEQLKIKFLNDSLKVLSISRGFQEIIKNLIPSSNLLSDIENKSLQRIKNLMSLGGSVIDSAQRVLPVLNVCSPLPFLASLFSLMTEVHDAEISAAFLGSVSMYLKKLVTKVPSLSDNWFTRIEIDFVFYIVKLSNQCEISEATRDTIYIVANKLCYILRIDKRSELEYLFNNILFNKQWVTAERLMNIVSLSDTDGSIEDIKQFYYDFILKQNIKTSKNLVLQKWQEPILPRDWIYLPILTLYSKSQETVTKPKVEGEHAKRVAALVEAEKKRIICCSLEWIIYNELCFPDLLNDIDVTDRFCRIISVFLCDNSLFLETKINRLLRMCTQMLFKKKEAFNFDKELMGLPNIQDFYTQFLEQFQSVSYGDSTFAACVLVFLAQRHNVKWRKTLWSEYAGCLRALDCPEDLLCYEMKDYFYPEETDESLLKSYFQALSGNLLRPNTVAYRIAEHHVQAFKQRTNK